MKLIFRVYGPDGETLDCDYAVLDVTPELAKRVRDVITLVNDLFVLRDAFKEIRFWRADLDYYEYDEELEETAGEDMDRSGYAPLPEYPPLREAKRTEMHQLIVFADGSFCFEAYPKHADLKLSTSRIELETLEKYL